MLNIPYEEMVHWIDKTVKQEKEKSFDLGVMSYPLSVSHWKEIGKKRGYWDYFEKQARQELKKELVEEIKNLSLGKYKSIVGNDEAYGYGLALNDLNDLIKKA